MPRILPAVLAAALLTAGCAEEGPTLGPAALPPAPSSSVPATGTGYSPADVKQLIRHQLGLLQGFRADVVMTKAVFGESRSTLERSPSGTVKESLSTRDGAEHVFLFDALAGRRLFYSKPGEGRGPPTARVETGVPPGPPEPPDPVPGERIDPVSFVRRPDPVSLARDVLAWEDFPVSREGGSVVAQRTTPQWYPDFQATTIDERTGLATRVHGLHGGQPVFEIRLENLTVGTGAGGSAPSFVIPDGTEVRSVDLGFGRTTLAEAGALAGYAPLVPAWLPDGFGPAEVAFAASAPEPTGTGSPGTTSHSIVATAFRRGLDLVIVSTRLRGTALWTNPFRRPFPPPSDPPSVQSPGLEPLRFEPVRLAGGAFGGVEAQRSANGRAGQSQLWTMNEELVLTIEGDVTGDEIVRMAESLRALR